MENKLKYEPSFELVSISPRIMLQDQVIHVVIDPILLTDPTLATLRDCSKLPQMHSTLPAKKWSSKMSQQQSPLALMEHILCAFSKWYTWLTLAVEFNSSPRNSDWDNCVKPRNWPTSLCRDRYAITGSTYLSIPMHRWKGWR